MDKLKHKIGLLVLSLFLVFGATRVVLSQTLRWAPSYGFISLDPYSYNDGANTDKLVNIYEPLVNWDQNLNIVPGLAVRWEMINSKKWRFYLRKNVTFANGNPFTADDVVFSLKRIKSKGSDLKKRVMSVKRVVKVDDHTFDLITRFPDPTLLTSLKEFLIMDKEWCEENKATKPNNFKAKVKNYAETHTNGTGPFLITSHVKGVKTIFEPNSSWWGWKNRDVNLTRIEMTPIENSSTSVAALLSGQVHLIDTVPPQDIPRIKRSASNKVSTYFSASTGVITVDIIRDQLPGCNIKGANPLKDIRVRKAMAHGLDKNAMAMKVMKNSVKPTDTSFLKKILPKGTEIPKFDYNVKLAKELLKSAGYPNGFEISMICDSTESKVCQGITFMLSRIGIKINLKILPSAVFYQKLFDYEAELGFISFTAGPDPVEMAVQIFMTRSTKGPGVYNVMGYSNNLVDIELMAAASEMNTNKRNQHIRKAFNQINQDLVLIPLYQESYANGLSNHIDYPIYPVDSYLMPSGLRMLDVTVHK